MISKALCVIAFGVLLLPQPAPAGAATYSMHVCRSHDGRVYGTDGWLALNPQPGTYYDLSCADGQFGVATGPVASPVPGFRTGWQFTLPKPLTISEIDVDQAGGVSLFSGWSSYIWGRLHDQPQWLHLSTCEGEFCETSLKHLPAYNMGALAFGIECRSTGCTSGSYAEAGIRYLRIEINDPETPTIDTAWGPLTGGKSISGQADMGFQASDGQSGVRTAALEADGRVVARTDFDGTAQTCHEPFSRFDPCPPTVTGSLAFDTTTLPDGPHAVRLLVYDATEANVAVGGPWDVVTSNRRVANVCPSTTGPGSRVGLRPATVGYGRGSSLSLGWRALPWADAEGVLLTGRDRLVASRRPAVRKGATHFVIDVPKGTNRLVRMGLRPRGTNGPFVCSRPVKLRVRAGTSLSASPHYLRNGDRVALHGRVAGGMAARGRTVVIEARAKSGQLKWTPVRVLHTNRKRRFALEYRFERTFRTTRYLFRARVPSQRGFPYVAGHSRRKSVLVEP